MFLKLLAELWKCVTRNNVCWQTVPQLSTSSGEGSVSNSCTLWLADIQLMGQWCLQMPPGRHVRQPARQDGMVPCCSLLHVISFYR